MFGILHRMILWELTKVFLLSLIGITGILLMAGIVAEASQQGLSPAQILEAIPLLIPSTLPYTIPATTLFATCVVYGRLAADNEILAIKAAGINLMAVVWPGLFLGIVMSATTMSLYYRIIPYTHRLLREMVYNDAQELLYSMLARQKSFSQSSLPYSIWVHGVQGRKLIEPLIKRRNPNDPNQIDVAQAKEGDLQVDVAHKQLLVHMKWTTTTAGDGSHAYFVDHVWVLELPEGFLKNTENRRARDMSWQEILNARRDLNAQIEKQNGTVALATSAALVSGAPAHLHENVKNHENVLAQLKTQRLLLDVELLMRPALSMGCLFFIMVGCPIGIWFSRSDYLSSFITCFLPIVFIYYPLMLCGTGIAKDGKFNPILMVWGANAVIAAFGIGMFWKLLRN